MSMEENSTLEGYTEWPPLPQREWPILPNRVLAIAQGWERREIETWALWGETFDINGDSSSEQFVASLMRLVPLARLLQQRTELHWLTPYVHHAQLDLRHPTNLDGAYITLYARNRNGVEVMYSPTQRYGDHVLWGCVEAEAVADLLVTELRAMQKNEKS